MSLPLISVVIVTYKGRDLLERFFPSVAGLSYPHLEFIVVDNDSRDGSVDFLRTRYPLVKIVEAGHNYGTAQGSNIGAGQARGEYIFFISNDMSFDPDMLTRLAGHLQSDPTIGICTCKMRRITDTGMKLQIIDSVGSDIDVFGFPAARGINSVDRGQWDYFSDVFFAFGGALLIRKKLFEEAGGYDPDFFTLADDIDLSWRVRLLGYRVVADPAAVLYHRVSATLGSRFGRSQKRFWSERNTLRMLLKNYSAASLLVVLPAYLILLSSEMIFFLILGKLSIAGAEAKALGWNAAHILQTLRLRKDIQRKRRVGDGRVFRCLRKTSFKIIILWDYLRNFSQPSWRAYFGEAKKGS